MIAADCVLKKRSSNGAMLPAARTNEGGAMAFDNRHLARAAAVLAVGLLAFACGEGSGKEDKLAYDGCVASAKKPGSKAANATLGDQKSSTFGYMQDSSITVRIPYEQAGQKGTFECSMLKQSDGSYKNQFD